MHFYICPAPGWQDASLFSCPGAPGDVYIFTCACEPRDQHVCIFTHVRAPGKQDAWVLLVEACLGAGCMAFCVSRTSWGEGMSAFGCVDSRS